MSQHQEDSQRNFRALLLATTGGKISDQLTNARSTLPWLMEQIGAPTWMLALLVPLRESLSMLPQILLTPWINRHARRKGIWVKAALAQALCLLLTPLGLLMPGPLLGGLWVLALLILFSLSRCFVSITFKDLSGKCISRDHRGRLNGYAGGLAGLAVVIGGLLLMLRGRTEDLNLHLALLLFGAGALLWCLGAWSLGALWEKGGEAQENRPVMDDLQENLQLLRSDRDLRLIVLSRALLMCPILTAPFLVVLASENGGALLLGSLILINGLASLSSAPLWGRLADVSSRRCMALSGLLGSVALGLAALIASAATGTLSDRQTLWSILACFALLNVAHAGIRTGRKTYTTNIAEGNQRTRYVATSNSVIGILLLIAGAIAGMIGSQSLTLLLMVFGAAGFAGAVSTRFMRDAERDLSTTKT